MTIPNQTASSPSPKNATLIVGVIIVIAVVAAGAAILLSGRPATPAASYEGITMERTADGAFVMGNPNARVTVVEFADYACSHCQTYLSTSTRFIEEYVKTGKARYEYRVYPTAGGPLTVFLGGIAACLDNQREGAFWEAKLMLYDMAMRGQYNGETGRVVAERLGLNYTQALNCQASSDLIQRNIQLGDAAGVTGTPAVRVRVNNGDLTWITVGGQPLDSGGVPFELLAQFVDNQNAS